MYERAMDFLIWMFRIDEQRSYEDQPQWLIVLFLSAPFSPRVWPFWLGTFLVAAIGCGRFYV